MTIHDASYNMPPGSGPAWQQYDAASGNNQITERDVITVLNGVRNALGDLETYTTEDDMGLTDDAWEALTKAVAAVELLLYRVKNRED